MRIEWYGQSAFHLSGAEASVAIDPFADLSPLASRGMHFDYPAIAGVVADLLLVTHEHRDHNGVEAIGGDPVVLRSTAGRLQSPIGEVTAIASEHDPSAGTERGPNTMFAFTLEDLRVCHFGDFGQRTLREEQAAAIGEVDLLILPVGDGPTIGADGAQAIVDRLRPRWVVPMHYPHTADQLPRDRRGVPRARGTRRAPAGARLRYRGAARPGRHAHGGSRGAVARFLGGALSAAELVAIVVDRS
jgi:L-ascorbate metabolism protein UlaG (beta-lactamase superfamily)